MILSSIPTDRTNVVRQYTRRLTASHARSRNAEAVTTIWTLLSAITTVMTPLIPSRTTWTRAVKWKLRIGEILYCRRRRHEQPNAAVSSTAYFEQKDRPMGSHWCLKIDHGPIRMPRNVTDVEQSFEADPRVANRSVSLGMATT